MKSSCLLASVALASTAGAQVSLDWVATHDVGPGWDNVAGAVAIDLLGRVAVGGNASYFSGGPSFVWFEPRETCLYGPDGTLLWSHSANFHQFESCSSVLFDGSGGLFVAGGGYSTMTFGGPPHRTLLRYDAVGNLLWVNNLSAPSWNWCHGYALAPCSNGDVILAGAYDLDLSLERFDPAGNVIWSWVADGGVGGSDILRAVAVGPGGDVWATGSVLGTAGEDIVVVRLTSTGALLWVRTLDGADHQPDYGNAVAVDAAGYAWVAGSIATTVMGSFGGGDAAIARWDPSGNLAWVRTYDGTAHTDDSATEITLDPFGRAIAAGSLVNGLTQTDFAVWCLDAAGSLIWQRSWDGPLSGNDYAHTLVVDATGAAWLGGSSEESGAGFGPYDLAVASWDSTGAPRWSWRYSGAGTGSNEGAGFAAINGDQVILAGDVDTGLGTLRDSLILRLTRTAVEYCVGTGSGTPCPCGNTSAPEQHAGCANSFGLGARLVDQGASSLAADTFVLAGSQMPNGTALYFQGTIQASGGAGVAFGDGLRCAGGTVNRLGMKTNAAGASQYPAGGDPSVSVRGLVTTPGTRTYQACYRNAALFCTASMFNLSNGLLVTWTL